MIVPRSWNWKSVKATLPTARHGCLQANHLRIASIAGAKFRRNARLRHRACAVHVVRAPLSAEMGEAGDGHC